MSGATTAVPVGSLSLDPNQVRAGSQTGVDEQAQVGDSVIYNNAGTLPDGSPVAVRVTVVSLSHADLQVDLTHPVANQVFLVNVNRDRDMVGETVEMRFDFFDQTTGVPVTLTGTATFSDIDNNGPGPEHVILDPNSFSEFGLSPDSSLSVVQTADGVIAIGSERNHPSDQDAWFQAGFEAQSGISVTFRAPATWAGYGFNGQDIDAVVNVPIEAVPVVDIDALLDHDCGCEDSSGDWVGAAPYVGTGPVNTAANPDLTPVLHMGTDDQDRLRGAAGDDTLLGREGSDWLWGADGHDTILGHAGDDTLKGGLGNDYLRGHSGEDLLIGNEGNDFMRAGADDDRLFGNAGNDTLRGEAGDDLLQGGMGDDSLNGETGNDTLRGGSDDDTLGGGQGDDVLEGGSGDDLLRGGSGNDQMNGGLGNDVIRGATGEDFLRGSNGNDRLYGGSSGDTLDGGSGDDSLRGQSGDDSMHGGWGDDHLTGATGADTLCGDGGNDVLYGGAGEDSLSGGANDDTLYGGSANDILCGDDGDDVLNGATGRDVLHGGSGNDKLRGGSHADLLFGGSGRDTLLGGEGDDTLTVAALDEIGATDTNDLLKGGNGADHFEFRWDGGDSAEMASVGNAKVLDFDLDEDRLIFVGAGVTLSDVVIADADGDGDLDTVLHLQNTASGADVGSVTLQNTVYTDALDYIGTDMTTDNPDIFL